MSKVIATTSGYDGQLRAKGEVFDCPKDASGKEITKASWYRLHSDSGKASKAKPPEKSEVADEGKLT